MILLLLAAGATVSGAYVQGIGLRVGYFKGTSFSGNTQGSSVSLQGFRAGADFSVFKLPLGVADLRISPTINFGGSNRKGADSDGTMLCVLANAKFSVPGSLMYGIAGVGYGTVRPRGGANFDSRSGAYMQLGLGMDIGPKLPLAPQPFVELGYAFGEKALSGLSLDVGVRF